jgi:hypothetical protein
MESKERKIKMNKVFIGMLLLGLFLTGCSKSDSVNCNFKFRSWTEEEVFLCDLSTATLNGDIKWEKLEKKIITKNHTLIENGWKTFYKGTFIVLDDSYLYYSYFGDVYFESEIWIKELLFDIRTALRSEKTKSFLESLQETEQNKKQEVVNKEVLIDFTKHDPYTMPINGKDCLRLKRIEIKEEFKEKLIDVFLLEVKYYIYDSVSKRHQFSHEETMFLNNVVYDHVIFLKDGTEVKIELMELSPSKALVKVNYEYKTERN